MFSHKLLILCILIFVCSANNATTKIKGEIYIKTSAGQNLTLGNVPVLLLKRVEAERLRNEHQTNNLLVLKKHLNFSQHTATTNSSGKFSFNVPTGDYSIAVMAERTIDGESGVFFWLIDIVNTQKSLTISLNNNNLTEYFFGGEHF